MYNFKQVSKRMLRCYKPGCVCYQFMRLLSLIQGTKSLDRQVYLDCVGHLHTRSQFAIRVYSALSLTPWSENAIRGTLEVRKKSYHLETLELLVSIAIVMGDLA